MAESTIPGVEDVGACSQQSNYSDFGDQDITGLIANYSTQPMNISDAPAPRAGLGVRQDSNVSTEIASQSSATDPPDSSMSGADLNNMKGNLGKRKADDSFASDTSIARTLFRPAKVQRGSLPTPPADPENLFLYGGNPAPPPPEETLAEAPPEEDAFKPISFSPPLALQNFLNSKGVPYGVQYELARYVNRGKTNSKFKFDYKDFKFEWANQLGDNQKGVAALRKFIAESRPDQEPSKSDAFDDLFAKERASKSPWEELDRELSELTVTPYGCLGFTTQGEKLDWYGGQVWFIGRLDDISPKNCKKPEYKLTLQPAELGPSRKLGRRFSSMNIFSLKLHKLNKNIDSLMAYVRRPLLLCGGVFRAFCAKEGTVFYIRTNETTDGTMITGVNPSSNAFSFLDFVQWANPMEHNQNQSMAKWASRFALSLSASVPGIKIDQADIKVIDDIVSKEGSNMTDGAGKINRYALNLLRHHLRWDDKPTAIQVRIFGSKGLLVDDGNHAEERTYVELTPSQKKIHFPDNMEMDPAHRILDVLRASHFVTPTRLAVETIINLAENGVDKKVFFDLLDKTLSELIEPLTEWESPGAHLRIYSTVCRISGAMAARRIRESVGLARVMGYTDKDAELADDDETGGPSADVSDEEKSVAYWEDEVSGCPASLAESVMRLIAHGFTFDNCRYLRTQMYNFMKTHVDTLIKGYKIEVPMSATAFLIPDTAGILEENEVFFKSSKRKFITPEGVENDVYVGDVLITRHPCKLPTDIRKWKSVDKPQLHHLVDVIVCSTKGARRAADYLGGGDYDGDKGIFIWQPEIVKPFKNAPLHFADPPPDIMSNFKQEIEKVSEFQEKVRGVLEEEHIRELQNALLGAVRADSVVGKYSNYHEIAIYTLGYTHPKTIRLAYMFCMSLDGIKSGLTVDKEVMSKDAQEFNKRAPKWKEGDDNIVSNEKNVLRPKSLGKFIMDDLYKHATDTCGTWKNKLYDAFVAGPFDKRQDPDLAKPWKKAVELAERHATEGKYTRMKEDLEQIKKHVEKMAEQHDMYFSGTMANASPRKPSLGSPTKKGNRSAAQSKNQDKLRGVSKAFASGPPNLMLLEEEIARLRASYAYIHDYHSNKGGRFAFQVAMRELGDIKARATGTSKTIIADFYEHASIKPPRVVAT